MKKQHLDIKTQDGVCDAYMVSPDGDDLPGVLLFMDAFGPRKHIFDMADKMASEGYRVLVPNVFYRMKKAPVVDVEKMGRRSPQIMELVPQIMPLIEALTPDLIQRDAKTYVEFMKSHHTSKIACVGYCMGGAIAMRVAAQMPQDIVAAASYHAGRLGADTPTSVLQILNQIKAEIYIAHADNDNSMPPEQQERIRQELDRSHAKYRTDLYRGAEHGFTMSDHPAYNEAADQKHWDTLFELFDRTLHS